MNEQQVLDHLNREIPQQMQLEVRSQERRTGRLFELLRGLLGGLIFVGSQTPNGIPTPGTPSAPAGPSPGSVFGEGTILQKIIDALRAFIGQAGIDVEVVIAAAKKFYDQYTAGDNPSIPNLFEAWVEGMLWMAAERVIRRMFAATVPVPVTGTNPGTIPPGAMP